MPWPNEIHLNFTRMVQPTQINVIYLINTSQKQHYHLNRCGKNICQIQQPTFMIKTFTKVGMEKINLSIIKSIYVVPAVVQWIKNLVLSQLWHRLQLLLKCDLWPGSFHMPWEWPKSINKLNKKLFITNPQPILNKEKLKSFLLKLRTRQGYSHHFYSTLYWKP